MVNLSKRMLACVCVVSILLIGFTVQASVTVDWSASFGNVLYEEDGTAIQTGDLLVQVIVDVGNNTDIAQMVAGRTLNIGSETGLGGVDSSATDDIAVGAFQGGLWVYDAGFMDFEGSGDYDVGTEYSKNYYFRWFNADDYGTATEAGFIYSAIENGWQTPAAEATSVPTRSLTYANRLDNDVAGTQFGTSGWSTVAAVPEPGMLGLLAVGLMTLVARRKRNK